ncbi:hypothetical protein FRX31_029348 [Thalictrum thalictroides]|uniref:Uncharacterized protein n=1 Tax=Thalictrum thalictroides TaxID=46969 RepID=A0A7J6V7G5_THATH|nr:hypothetical protein FRX31_029348 [Thalictrum thalictroides]
MDMKVFGRSSTIQASFIVCSKVGHSLDHCRKKNPTLIQKDRDTAGGNQTKTLGHKRNLQVTFQNNNPNGLYQATGKIFAEPPTGSTFEQGETSNPTTQNIPVSTYPILSVETHNPTIITSTSPTDQAPTILTTTTTSATITDLHLPSKSPVRSPSTHNLNHDITNTNSFSALTDLVEDLTTLVIPDMHLSLQNLHTSPKTPIPISLGKSTMKSLSNLASVGIQSEQHNNSPTETPSINVTSA